MSELAIKAVGLSKRYTIHQRRADSLSESLMYSARRAKGALRRHARHILRYGVPSPTPDTPVRRDFWALKDVSFDLKHGEVLGVLGANGAGKSTLLKILSQLTPPTEGWAELYGRVGSLLEVGTGFNPELTGRENIFLYGSILGMSRAEVARRFDEIVAFSGIEEFLDEPIKHYSSGMHTRLGFSVAAHLDCDILLVDEVLAVGDAAFRAKSLKKMDNVTGQGRAVIFVSHNMAAINKLCDRAIVLERGEIIYRGSATEATDFYLGRVLDRSECANPIRFPALPDKAVQFLGLRIADEAGLTTREFHYDQSPVIEMDLVVRRPSQSYVTMIRIYDAKDNVIIFTTDEDLEPSKLCETGRGEIRYSVKLPPKMFRIGIYIITINLNLKRAGPVDIHESVASFEICDDKDVKIFNTRFAMVQPEIAWTIVESRAFPRKAE